MAITPPWLKNQIRNSSEPRKVETNGAARGAELKKQNEVKKERRARAKDIADQRGTGDGMIGLEVAVEDEPSYAMKLRYEEFARQFLVDFSQTRAAVRMGYSKVSAATTGNALFWQPYTQAYLVKLIREIEEHTIVSRNDVLTGLLREAHNFNIDANSASRIKAWSEIGKILGMYVQRVELSANSSGVMEVPMVADATQWESLAHSSQTKLLELVRQ